MAVVLTGIWMGHFRGGMAWQSDPKLEFNWHPMLMVVGMVFLYGNGKVLFLCCNWNNLGVAWSAQTDFALTIFLHFLIPRGAKVLLWLNPQSRLSVEAIIPHTKWFITSYMRLRFYLSVINKDIVRTIRDSERHVFCSFSFSGILIYRTGWAFIPSTRSVNTDTSVLGLISFCLVKNR